MPRDFQERKRIILSQLAVPDQDYTDLSPKGSVDEGIRELVDDINRQDGFVTTSSCAGRVAVFLEGAKRSSPSDGDVDREQGVAGVGGKGGGKWLYVSHDPVDLSTLGASAGGLFAMLGIESPHSENQPELIGSDELQDCRYIHIKFEPMILHVLASSLENAQLALSAGMTAGFRESGISGVLGDAPVPMVAVRSGGLAFDCIIGHETRQGMMRPLVTEGYIRAMFRLANDRFVANSERTNRFRQALLEDFSKSGKRDQKADEDWEPAELRRERKRAEGLLRREEMLSKRRQQEQDSAPSGLGSVEMSGVNDLAGCLP